MELHDYLGMFLNTHEAIPLIRLQF
jgi:hypothetical protein